MTGHGRLRAGRLSLRYRLTLIAAVAVAVAVVAVSLAAFVAVRHQLGSQLDAQLTQDAQAVAASPRHGDPRVFGQVAVDPDRDGDAGDDSDHDVSPRIQLLGAYGDPARATGRPAVLPVTARGRAVAEGRADRVFEDVHVAGREYRMLTLARRPAGAVQVAVSLDNVHRTLDRTGLIMLLVGSCGVAAAAALGWLVARAGLRPVDRLAEAVDHVANTSDLAGRIEVRGRDEIAALASGFNAMLAALASSRAAQRLLVEDAGHELRTPLSSLRTNIELLIRAEERAGTGRELPAADRARLLADLDEQVRELTQLVGELVDLAREDAGAEPAEHLDLAELVELAVRDRTARDTRTPRVGVDTALEPVVVRGRPTSLARMVSNVVDNAVKWSPPGGTVRVRLDVCLDTEHDGHRRWARLSVADSGPGIAEQDLPRIFERFYRSATSRSVPGSGLGLAIVAQAVALHGGTVTAGRSDTGGAVFTIRLPALTPDP